MHASQVQVICLGLIERLQDLIVLAIDRKPVESHQQSLHLCRGKSVMLDCGIHPGYSGEHSLPYFDLIDLNEVNLMLITHFHLDHCAAVPYVVGNTNFKVCLRPSSMQKPVQCA